jgi:hypothetical protein
VYEDVGEIVEGEVLSDPVERYKSGDDEWHKWQENDKKWFKKIYLDYGWPGEAYRKDEALAEIARQWEALYGYC